MLFIWKNWIRIETEFPMRKRQMIITPNRKMKTLMGIKYRIPLKYLCTEPTPMIMIQMEMALQTGGKS